MAPMIALNPPIGVYVIDNWQLIAIDAGRPSQGLTLTVQVWDGTIRDCRLLAFALPDKRAAFANVVAQLSGVTPEEAHHRLLELGIAVEAALLDMGSEAGTQGTTQSQRLVQLIIEAGVELFRHGDVAFATLPMGGHRETWQLDTKGFERLVKRLYYNAEGKPPGAQAVRDALGMLDAIAPFDGPLIPVHTRIAELNGRIYLDLVNNSWQAVEITEHGWDVVDDPPVRFRRARGMLPLPTPVHGGSLSALRPFINIADETSWILSTAWLIGAFRPTGPYPLLVLHGEQGSAKSTTARVMRSLIDPNLAILRTTPRDERDLMIAATNGWVIALDNLSRLTPSLSDAMCRLSTGGGFATRELFSNAEETILTAQRPQILNGIEELATRGDLLDRAILLYLPAIQEQERRDEQSFWQAFEEQWPAILGALLDIVSGALHRLHTVDLDTLPRMADFAKWACAAAPSCDWSLPIGEEGASHHLDGRAAFLHAYRGNRAAAHDLALEASLVAIVLREFIAGRASDVWENTVMNLLTALKEHAGEETTRQRLWPKSPKALANSLRRLAPNLRAVGIDIEFLPRIGSGVPVRICRTTLPESSGSPHDEHEEYEI